MGVRRGGGSGDRSRGRRERIDRTDTGVGNVLTPLTAVPGAMLESTQRIWIPPLWTLPCHTISVGNEKRSSYVATMFRRAAARDSIDASVPDLKDAPMDQRRRGTRQAGADIRVSPPGLASCRSRSVNASMRSVTSNARLR